MYRVLGHATELSLTVNKVYRRRHKVKDVENYPINRSLVQVIVYGVSIKYTANSGSYILNSNTVVNYVCFEVVSFGMNYAFKKP